MFFFFPFSIPIQDFQNLKERDLTVAGDGGTPLSEGQKALSASPGKWGFSCHPAPLPLRLLVDMNTQTPLTGWACVKQGLGPFPGIVEGTWCCWTPS